MVRHSSRSELECRLSALGEQPSLAESKQDSGHLQHRCVQFRGTVVNFWPSKSSWNVQGDEKGRLEALLDSSKAPIERAVETFDRKIPARLPPGGQLVDARSSVKTWQIPSVNISSQSPAPIATKHAHQLVSKDPCSGGSPSGAPDANTSLQGSSSSSSSLPASPEPAPPQRSAAAAPVATAAAALAAAAKDHALADDRRAAEAALNMRVSEVIARSFEQWRCEQRGVMRRAYDEFCAERKRACQSPWSFVAQQGPLPPEVQSAISAWHLEEVRALERRYTEWESAERKALGEVFEGWRKEWCRLMAVEQADMQHELHVQARRDLEQWKSQEKASLLADVKFACEVAKGEQLEQQEQLCNVMQHCRDGLKQISELEKDRDELRARAEQAEAALQVQQESSVRRAQKRPVFSTRTEHIAKRVCAEHDLRLREFDGDLFSKINQAFQARKITRREKDDMHQARMEGNRAAHEPQGYFGTQVAASDAFDIGSGHDVWASGDCLDEPDEDSADEVAWQS